MNTATRMVNKPAHFFTESATHRPNGVFHVGKGASLGLDYLLAPTSIRGNKAGSFSRGQMRHQLHTYANT
jgi:hypothetical protein